MALLKHNGKWFRVTAEQTCEPPQPWVDPNQGAGAVSINYSAPEPEMGRYVAVVEDIQTRTVTISEETYMQESHALREAIRMVAGK